MSNLTCRCCLAVAVAFGLVLTRGVASGQIVISEIMYHPLPTVPEVAANEWIELQNRGTDSVNLAGWRFAKGVDYTFSMATISPGGYLILAANLATFQTNYPGVTNVVGGWTGKLANGGETIELQDALGNRVARVTYCDEGDWAERRIGEVYPGQPTWWRGWQWMTPADWLGKSLELVNPDLPLDEGQNWAPSLPEGGTPGMANSMATNNSPPLILDVAHFPVIPRSTNTVTVTARVLDEASFGVAVTVLHRVDGSADFSSVVMLDDGVHGDGAAGDRTYGATLPPQPDQTVVEFYVRAVDAGGRIRTWPGPTDEVGTQGANALYQVDESTYAGNQPVYRLIFPLAEWNAWVNLMDNVSNGQFSNAEMNGTLIRLSGLGTELRYNVGVRNRGQGTRYARPHNLFVSVPADRPLGGLTKLAMNTRTVHSQAAGDALCVAAGLPKANGVPVQVRLNGKNLANATPGGSVDTYQFGSYYCIEPYNTDWAASHFPLDPAGNLYRGQSWFDTVQLSRHADLAYLGTNVAAYRLAYSTNGPASTTGAYSKVSNSAEDDWWDLIALTCVLSTNASDAAYLAALTNHLNVEQCLRYFAVNSLLLNMETCLATGVGDDYALYRGVLDPRFQFLTHDLDTVLGQGDATPSYTRSIFKAADLPTINRFLKHPAIAPQYFAILKNLAETTFAPVPLGLVIDQALGDWVPAAYLQAIKDAAERRRTNVLAQIPMTLTVQSTLPISDGYPRTTAATTSLAGTAPAIETRVVQINGLPADYVPWQGSWTASSLAIYPGLNRLLVQALDVKGVEVARTHIDVWRDDGSVHALGGTMVVDTSWTAGAGPYQLTNDLVIASGVTLTIEPGTSVYLGPSVDLTVADGGRLLAEGTLDAPIRFTSAPGSGASWGGLTIVGSAGSPETRIAHAHFEGNGSTCIQVTAGTVFLDHVSFGTATRRYLSLDGASFTVQDCIFPSAAPGALFELVHGTGGVKAGGRGLFLRNFFGAANSISGNYNDVIDFSNGQRPGPIVQFINNVFIGTGDDHLDLDDADAWIEGNIFLHAHKNGSPDTSSAISAGSDTGNTAEITILGNIIYDCDHVALAKQNNFFTLLNNTIVRQTPQGGLDTEGAIVCLQDNNMTEGAGVYAAGNIIYDAEQLTRDVVNAIVTFTNNLMALPWTGPGGGNIAGDPRFMYWPELPQTKFSTWQAAQVLRQWFSLRAGSPGLGAGLNGRDLGAVNSRGASLSGEPPLLTGQTTATLRVGTAHTGSGIPSGPSGFPHGSGYTHYRWRLNGGIWSPEVPISTPIALTDLTNGTYRVEVSGMNDAATYQDAPELGSDARMTSSRFWTVNTSLSGLRLNEVLARNGSTLVTNGESPDLVELFNAGTTAVDLSGKGLTDDPLQPHKFTFPLGTSLEPGQFLVLYADTGDNPGPSLGFGFNSNGDDLHLFESAANNSTLMDRISFGPQLVDLSIGRLADGSWGLCRPTFGAPNQAHSTGDIFALKINEWFAAGSAALPEDFVELFNPDLLPVHSGGLYLSDAPGGSPTRHQLALLSFIPGGGYFAFKADGNTDAGPEHLNFSLAAELGSLGLFAPDRSLIDLVRYGPQSVGVSQGRSPNGTAALAFFATPTPGSGNPGGAHHVVEITTRYDLIGVTNRWRYLATGDYPGPTWTQATHSDTDWSVGAALLGVETSSPMPYASPILTPLPLTSTSGTPIISYYFRTFFNVPDDLAGFTIDAGAYVDDGAVFYLNGNELTRLRLPSGAISHGTLATNQPVEGAREALTIPAELLTVGTNLFAVELHQTTTNSSDVVFGLTLSAARTVTITNYSQVVINELMVSNSSFTNADGTMTDWVELYNPSSNSVSLAGFGLTDDVTVPRRWVVPAGVSLDARSFLLIRCDPGAPPSLSSGPVLNTGFGLDSDGDGVYLFDAAAAFFDSVTFGPQPADFSLGHSVDGAGGWDLLLPTPGSGNIAAVLASPASVRINEWAASVSGGPDWFELYNPEPQPVALGGYTLTDRLATRDKHLIAPLTFIGVNTNGFLKFVADNDAAQGPNHVGFALDATAGEALGLFPPGIGPAIDTVIFGPQTKDISEGRLPDGAATRVFFPIPSPAEANWLPLTNIVINEVLTHTDVPLEDAIELCNLSDAPVDISGWYLSDSSRWLRKFRIPENTVVPAFGYQVFYEYQINPDPTLPDSFSFSSADGDEAWLVAVDANGTTTGFRDHARFGAQFNGVSFGRFQTSVGPDFTALSALSFGTSVTAQSPPDQIGLFRSGTGAPNAYPRVGPVVVSEIMYRPPPVDTNDNVLEEFIELRNLSTSPMPLYDPVHPTNGWRLRDAVSFDFTTNHTLPAGGCLVVVGFDPATNGASLAAFRFRYGTAATLVGPWSGKLANNGEAIELLAPDTPNTVGVDLGVVPYVLMERIAYSNLLPWPTNADGMGWSLQRSSLMAYGNDPVNWTAALPTAGATAMLDTDADGMPDTWEEVNGLDKLLSDATLDPDHDGLSNLQEYLAGTLPQDALSALRLEVHSATGDATQMWFVAVAGHSYSVLYSTNLAAGSWVKLRDVAVLTSSGFVIIDDVVPPNEPARYYRLVTPALP